MRVEQWDAASRRWGQDPPGLFLRRVKVKVWFVAVVVVIVVGITPLGPAGFVVLGHHDVTWRGEGGGFRVAAETHFGDDAAQLAVGLATLLHLELVDV